MGPRKPIKEIMKEIKEKTRILNKINQNNNQLTKTNVPETAIIW